VAVLKEEKALTAERVAKELRENAAAAVIQAVQRGRAERRKFVQAKAKQKDERAEKEAKAKRENEEIEKNTILEAAERQRSNDLGSKRRVDDNVEENIDEEEKRRAEAEETGIPIPPMSTSAVIVNPPLVQSVELPCNTVEEIQTRASAKVEVVTPEATTALSSVGNVPPELFMKMNSCGDEAQDNPPPECSQVITESPPKQDDPESKGTGEKLRETTIEDSKLRRLREAAERKRLKDDEKTLHFQLETEGKGLEDDQPNYESGKTEEMVRTHQETVASAITEITEDTGENT
jgi:hypothetical protein